MYQKVYFRLPNSMLRTFFGGVLTIMLLASFVFAVEDSFEVIPEATSSYGDAVEDLWKNKKQDFRNKYQYFADSFDAKKEVGNQLASGIMSRDTIFLLLAHAVRILSNIALVIGAAMIVYAGYLYVVSVYAGDNAAKANGAIKRALIWIVVVIFSYAIIRIAVKAFL